MRENKSETYQNIKITNFACTVEIHLPEMQSDKLN